MGFSISHRHARAFGGTLLLSGIGAVVGGLIGTALLVLLPVLELRPSSRPPFDLVFALTWGGSFGAVVGAMVAPLAGWTFLRHVPLGRAVGATAAGTLVGALIVVPQPVIGGILGYVTAAILSRRYKAHRPQANER